MADIINAPIKFLGATVLSTSTSIGYGSSSESTLSVELVEDCDANDQFLPSEVGAPIYFNCGSFIFGGILTGWTENISQSGKTFSVRASDPRQLLDNFTILVDTEIGAGVGENNVFDIWGYWDSTTQADSDQGTIATRKVGNECDDYPQFNVQKDNINDPKKGQFGRAQSSERGMKYRQIIDALECKNPSVYSNTGYEYSVDFTTFPAKALVPDFYRIQGPTTLLQLLQNICDILGQEFYVYLEEVGVKHTIKIGLIDLTQEPGTFNGIVTQFKGCATDLSYGQELRHDKIKTAIFGENYHTNEEYQDCYFYFGAELYETAPNANQILRHIVPQKAGDDGCGFWIFKSITELNATLHKPIAPLAGGQKNGPYSISELDLRAAMSGFKVWKNRTFSKDIPGSFNRAVRNTYPIYEDSVRDTINGLEGAATAATVGRALPDAAVQPTKSDQNITRFNEETQDVEKVYAWIKQLADTYYGRQFLVPMKNISYYLEDDNVTTMPNPEQSQFMFTKVPTNAGGWTDPINGKVTVLGLSDPALQFFKQDDGRVSSFASFPIEINKEAGCNDSLAN